MKPILAIVAAGLAVAACSSEPAAPENATQTVSPENNIAAKVASMGDNERNVVLIRAIRDAGMDCQGVTESEISGDPSEMTWRAKCTNGDYHLVQISPDGTATVISRTN